MSDTVITVENLSKSYLVGHKLAGQGYKRYTALRDVIADELRDFARNAVNIVRGRQVVLGDQVEEFWALKDVSFEVKRGEVLGIIGRNGAGKSTLLKILSRITEPTEGRVLIRGRVASLLEVGTGFHSELTGRENIYLNGAILGMTRAEIRRKFDEIVAFAEVEKFLDTPVKRYSSGMYVRLAFAVAAHLEPEILIVDEVLAVGDVEFQKKCLGKMSEVAGGGRTVLFVSHDMPRAIMLCAHGILLNAGEVEWEGDMVSVASRYSGHRTETTPVADLSERRDRSGSADAEFQSIELLRNNEPCRTFVFGESFAVRVKIKARRQIRKAILSVTLNSSDGVPVHEFVTCDVGWLWTAEIGIHTITATIERVYLYPGMYSIDLWLGDRNFGRIDYIKDVMRFNVTQMQTNGITRRLERSNGLVFQPASWQFGEAGPFALSDVNVNTQATYQDIETMRDP